MQSRLGNDKIFSDTSRQVGNYLLDKVQRNYFDNSNSNTPGFGTFNSVRHIRENYVDDESNLFGINKPLSKKDPVGYNTFGLQGLDKGFFDSSDSTKLLPNSVFNIKNKKSNSIDRFQYLHINPQNLDNLIINEPNRGGLHTRNFEKDNYNCSF